MDRCDLRPQATHELQDELRERLVAGTRGYAERLQAARAHLPGLGISRAYRVQQQAPGRAIQTHALHQQLNRLPAGGRLAVQQQPCKLAGLGSSYDRFRLRHGSRRFQGTRAWHPRSVCEGVCQRQYQACITFRRRARRPR